MVAILSWVTGSMDIDIVLAVLVPQIRLSGPKTKKCGFVLTGMFLITSWEVVSKTETLLSLDCSHRQTSHQRRRQCRLSLPNWDGPQDAITGVSTMEMCPHRYSPPRPNDCHWSE